MSPAWTVLLLAVTVAVYPKLSSMSLSDSMGVVVYKLFADNRYSHTRRTDVTHNTDTTHNAQNTQHTHNAQHTTYV